MSENHDVFLMPLEKLQPSQLYISQEKLKILLKDINFILPDSIPPIPVKILMNRVVMMDGHTRAFAAFLSGIKEVPVYYDQDVLDWEAYAICVDWCLEADITSVKDFQGRVISSAEYEQQWLDRCRRMQEDLEALRQSNVKPLNLTEKLYENW